MPDRRTFTGWRCRKKFERTASVRFLGVSGYPWRKIDFQIWVARTFSKIVDIRGGTLSGRTGGAKSSDRVRGWGGASPRGGQASTDVGQVGPLQRPLPLLFLELGVLVDQDLPVVGERDLVAFERSRSRPLEVDAGLLEARALARALEVLLGGEPVRRAPEVRAGRRQAVEARRLAHDPDPACSL